MELNYIIVDEEPHMHDLIKDYCNELDYMKFVGSCYKADEVYSVIEKHNIAIIFLDINIPKLQGYDFLRALKNPVKIIVVTTSKDHTLEGYELNISDYLLKPFSLERFVDVLQKLQTTLLSHLNSIKKDKGN